MNLTEWAQAHGIRVTTAYRWYREGTLPVPAGKAGRLILVSPDTAAVSPGRGGAGLYARVSCHDQKAGLRRQVARLPAWAAQAGLPVVRAGAGVGSGMNGSRPEVRWQLAGSGVSVVVAGHRGRLGRMNIGLAEAALAAHHRRLVVLEESEVTGDLVRDMTGVLTLFCGRRYGRRPARNRALKAVGCAQRDVGPRAVLAAGGTPCGGAG